MEVGVISELSGEQACISVWNLNTGVRLKNYKNCACAPNSLDFIANNYILSAQHDKQLIHVYDSHNERLVKRIVCPGKISCLVVSPCGTYCVVALQEKIYVWHVSTGNLVNVISKHYQSIRVMKFTQDGVLLVTCADDNVVMVWKFVDMLQPRDPYNDGDLCDSPLHSLMKHSMPVYDLHIGVGGMRTTAVTCSIDHTCVLFDLCTGRVICTFVFDVACTAVAMDIVERRLFAGTLDGNIYSVGSAMVPQDREQVHVEAKKGNKWKAHGKSVNCIAVMGDGTKLLSGSLDCMVKLWHISNHQCLKMFDFKGQISNIAIKVFTRTFEQDDLSAKTKPSIGTFKRTVFMPGNYNQLVTPNEEDDEDTLFPTLLRDLRDEESLGDDFLSDHSIANADALVEKVLMGCVSTKTSSLNFLDPKSATRSELLEGVVSLEAMTKEIHTFAVDKLLKDVETEEQAKNGLKLE